MLATETRNHLANSVRRMSHGRGPPHGLVGSALGVAAFLHAAAQKTGRATQIKTSLAKTHRMRLPAIASFDLIGVLLGFKMVGWAGLEPATNGLKGRCSTD